MFKNYLTITLRNLMKNKVFVLINVMGLGIALVCCIVAFLNWDYNAKFDACHTNAQNAYRVNFVRITNGYPINNGSSPTPLGNQIRTSIPQVDQVVHYYPIGGNFRVNNDVFRTDVSAVDPNFFQVFNFPMVVGEAASLADKQSILISTEIQQKHFPDNSNPIGETLTYINDEIRIDFRVGGVFEKPPKNSSFGEDVFIQYDNALDFLGWDKDNWAYFNNTFVTINNPADVAVVEQQLQNYVAIQNTAKEDYKVDRYYLDPFPGLAVRSEREDTRNHWLRQSLPTSAAIAPSIMAFLLLLIACFNFTNTSIAISNRRIKEIGIRKVLGSNRRQLIGQFLGENILLVLIALGVGLGLAVFLVPAYSAMWPFLDIELNLIENLDLIGFLGILLLFTAIIAGSYPAFYVSSFQPTSIFRGRVKFGGTNTLTRVLLTLQYAISLLAIIAGFVFSQNARFQEEYDMGFDMERIVSAYVYDEQGYSKMRNELMGTDKIKEIAGSRHSISSSWYTDPIKYQDTEMDVSLFDVGSGYISTVGATLIEGRDFIKDSQTDVESSVIINQELVRTMGWESAIGKQIILRDTIALNVVGVVKDIYFEGGLWDPLDPMLLRYADASRFRFISVRTDSKDLLAVKGLMDNSWQKVFPDELSTVRFMDEEKVNAALVNNNIKVLFMFLGLVAVLLSVIGMFSLVSLNIIKRMKEIGVRKVLGATIENIALKVSREFIIVLTIASILGSVGAYFLTDLLMGSIWAYHVPLKAVPFIISIAILFIASGVTIGSKVFKAASTNPAHVLRSE